MSDLIEFKVNVCGWHPEVGALISASEAQKVIDLAQEENQQLKQRIAELEQERDSLKPCAILAVNTLLSIESCAFDCGDDYPDAKEAAHWMQGEATKWLNDHADRKSCLKNHNIEQRIKGLEKFADEYCDDEHVFFAEKLIEQLRKGGE